MCSVNKPGNKENEGVMAQLITLFGPGKAIINFH